MTFESLLADARYYVATFEPRTADEQSEQGRLLQAIDAALPPAPEPIIERCDNVDCYGPKGHDGDHDFLPF
jgi:hypothetical protein